MTKVQTDKRYLSNKPRVLILAITLALFSSNSIAAATLVPELSKGAASTAKAGSAALAENAQTAFSNPAGMSQLNSDTISLGMGSLFLNIRYDSDNGVGADNAGKTTPYGSLYYVKTLGDDWRLGLSIASQGGASLDYGSEYDGRSVLNNVSLMTLQFNPSISYRINNYLSVGAGVQIEYASFDQNMMLEGVNANGDTVSYGWNVGVLIDINESNRLGFSYRSQIKHDIETDFTSNGRTFPDPRLNFMLNQFSGILPQGGRVQLYVPEQAELSGVHRLQYIDPKLFFLWTISYEGWSKYDETAVRFNHPTIDHMLSSSVSTPRYFSDMWNVSVGFHYKLNQQWRLEFGMSYNNSINNVDKPQEQAFDIPNDRGYQIGLGTTYTIHRNASLNLYYEYLNYGTPTISGVDPIRGEYNGRFNNNSNLFGVMLNWTF